MQVKTIMEFIDEVISGKVSEKDAEQAFSVLFSMGRWRKEEELALFRLPNAPEVLKKYLECGNRLHSVEAEKQLFSLPNAKELFAIYVKNGYVFNPQVVISFLNSPDMDEYLLATIDQGQFMGYNDETIVWSSGFEKVTERPDAGKLFIRILEKEKRPDAKRCLCDLIRKPWIDTLSVDEHVRILELAVGFKMYLLLRSNSQELLLKRLPKCIVPFIEQGGVFDDEHTAELFKGQYDEYAKLYIFRYHYLPPMARKVIFNREDAQYWVDLCAKSACCICDANRLKLQYFVFRIKKAWKRGRR